VLAGCFAAILWCIFVSKRFRLASVVAISLLAMTACGGSSSSSSSMPPVSSGTARVRFADGAPELEALINGYPQSIGSAYLQVDGQTVSSEFNYGTLTNFLSLTPGAHSLTALDILGYRVGPIKSASLSAGKDYTLILVGAYPKYSVLVFEEPASSKGDVQLSLYEASPSVPSADFGSFAASSHKGFKQLGSAKLGNVVTVSLGAGVSNFGGYTGKGKKPFTCGSPPVPCGDLTLRSVDTFDKHNVLPFHNASRFSLFLFDAASTGGPVFGSLDR
jgi:hypothetical protein